MGIFDKLFGNNSTPSTHTAGLIDYGKQKQDGSHNHTFNKGDDQTPAQKEGHKQAEKTKAGKN
ncbi:MAG: hypothetical protein Q7U18_05600 [Methylobacter sp.]|nr:hypothetical protein [Methylobacter sp.]